jgi:hypothetical protein
MRRLTRPDCHRGIRRDAVPRKRSAETSVLVSKTTRVNTRSRGRPFGGEADRRCRYWKEMREDLDWQEWPKSVAEKSIALLIALALRPLPADLHPEAMSTQDAGQRFQPFVGH